jgi:FKBP-type peptidyl-prolyl cis-trans isomerase FklB
MDKLSYSYGIIVGQNLKEQGLDSLNSTDFSAGLKAILDGANPAISLQEASQIVQKSQADKAKQQYDAVLQKGQQFLNENSKREGVKVTPTGLQYEVINAGTGNQPAATDKVTVHYEGALINGTVFDSSYKRGAPATFPVNGVIPGWVEALQMMQEGAKWKLFIPYDLAYGERGAGGDIGPYETLIFDVELLKIG